MEQQSIAYSKQRLSDNSEQINDAYLEALNKTKYQVLTGYNNSEANYADLTYNQITGCNTVANGKQYLVKDKEGKVLVNSAVAKAYDNNNGDFNRFLRDMGYTQSDIDVSKVTESKEAVHEAWDKYLASVGKSIDDNDGEHILGFDYTSFSKDSYDGYPTYDTAYAATKDGQNIDLFKDSNGYYKERYALEARTVENDDGTTSTVVCYQTEDQQGTDDYNVVNDVTYNTETKKFTYKNQEGNDVEVDALYADPSENLISESYKNYLTKQADGSFVSEGGTSYDVTKSSKALNFEGTTPAQRELYDYAVSITEAYYNDKVSGNSQNLKYDKEMVN